MGAALLIGNAAYQHSGVFPRLSTPASDVANLGDRLEALGFATLRCIDATRTDMGRAFDEFGRMLERLPSQTNAFFYFAGHGLQQGGENYLVPLDAGDSDPRWSCVRLSEVTDALCARADQQKWLAIDACRSNALPGQTRSGLVGLAGESIRRYERIKQTTVLYATAPSHVASDGRAYGSSPFCRAILKALDQPYRGVRELTLDVTNLVSEATDEMQVPWETTCATRQWPFVPSPGGAQTADRPPIGLPPATSSDMGDEARYVSERGHLIHKLKAKDETGRWAYYFVLVEPEREAEFLASIKGEGTLDLEMYGRVIASSYGEAPTDEVRAHLNRLYGFNI